MDDQGEFEDPRVEEALQKVLDSTAFASSKQSQALLKYLVTQSQHQDDSSLKERMIGVNVKEQRAVLSDEANAVGLQEAGCLALVAPLWRLLVAGAVIVATIAGVVVYRQAHRVSNLDMFWSPVLESPQTVIIYLGQNGAFMPTQRYMRRIREARPMDEDEKLGTDVQLDDLNPGETLGADDVYVENHDLVSAGNIAASLQIASLLGSRHHAADLRTGDGLSAEDLKQAPAVLLGAFDNRWTMQISETLPFRFKVLAGETDAIVEQGGQKRAWVTHMIGPKGEAKDEYAIVARLSSSVYRRPVIVAAGLRSRGTRAAGDFLTDPTELSKFLETIPPGWKQKNLEVVLQAEIVKGVPGTAHPIAYSVW